MTNPANQLHRLLEAWAEQSYGSIAATRQNLPTVKTAPRGFWHEQATAVRLLQDVEQALVGLEATGSSVAAYWEAVPDWYEMVFATELIWSQGTSPDPARTQLGLRMLRAVSNQLDEMALSDDIDASEQGAIRAALVEAETLVRSESSLPRAGKAYLLALLGQALYYLANVEEYGGSQLRRAAHEVSGALYAAADSGVIPPAQTSAWRSAAAKFGLLVLIPTAALASARVVDHLLPPVSASENEQQPPAQDPQQPDAP